MEDKTVKELTAGLEERFKKGQHVIILCHPKDEQVVRPIIEQAGLVVVDVKHEYNQQFLHENQVVIMEQQPMIFRMPEPDISKIMEQCKFMDAVSDRNREHRAYMKQQHKLAQRFYRK